MKVHSSYDAAYREHAKHVWAIAYRMTGSAQDADDLVQDTFVRAMGREATGVPEGDLRPWLARIAIHAGIDLLRRRRRRAYVGPWLPEPITTEDASSEPSDPGAATRYDLLESTSFAFLLSLEALTPRARAVLLLRDVFEYSVRETVEVLGMTETHVKVTLHRARRVMSTYDQARCIPTRALQEQTRAALERLLSLFLSRDVQAIEDLLAENVRSVADSAGDYVAARLPVFGRKKVTTFWLKTSQTMADVHIDLRMLNSLPALVISGRFRRPDLAPRSIFMLQLDGSGRVNELRTIVAVHKLTRLLGPEPRRGIHEVDSTTQAYGGRRTE